MRAIRIATATVLLLVQLASPASAAAPASSPFDFDPRITTTSNATIAVAFLQEFGPRSCSLFSIEVAAVDPATPDARAFYFTGMVMRGVGIATVQPSAIGTIAGTAGASTWLVTVDSLNNSLRVQVTGAVGKTIHWIVHVKGTTVHFV